MADPPAKPESKSQFGFLTRKIGPLPVWAWGAIAVGAYYWYTHYGPGAAKTAAAKQPAPQRPQVIIVTDGKGGRRPPSPPPGPPPPPPKRKRKSGPPRITRTGPPLVEPPSQPVTAAAPMTASDIYGDIPTASPDGTTYDSGYPSAAQLEGAYVPAG